MKVTCPHCEIRIYPDYRETGKTIRCVCGRHVQIPLGIPALPSTSRPVLFSVIGALLLIVAAACFVWTLFLDVGYGFMSSVSSWEQREINQWLICSVLSFLGGGGMIVAAANSPRKKS